MWPLLESPSRGQLAPFPSLVFPNENGPRPSGMMRATRRLPIPRSRLPGACHRTPTPPSIIGTGTKSGGILKTTVDTRSKGDHQNAHKPLNHGWTGRIVLPGPTVVLLLNRGTVLQKPTQQSTTGLGSPPRPGSPLRPESANLTGIKTDSAMTTTTNILLVGDVEGATREGTTTTLHTTTKLIRSPNEIGGPMTRVPISASSQSFSSCRL
jgi:hypothetical protein